MHLEISMFFSHIKYHFTNWSLTGVTTFKPTESLFKKVIKVFDLKKTNHSHSIIVTYWKISFIEL